MMTTSTGTRQLFNKVGRFDLVVDGQPVQLQAYQSAEREDPSLFIPFKDATSGKETYGAARYLDMRVEHDDNYLRRLQLRLQPVLRLHRGLRLPPPARGELAEGRDPGGREEVHHD